MMFLVNLSIASAVAVIGNRIYQKKPKKKLIDYLIQAELAPQKSKENIVARQPVSEDIRSRQLKEMSSGSDEMDHETDIVKAEKTLDQHFKISSVSLAITTIGALFYSPLLLFGIPGIVYTAVSLVFPDAYHSLVKKHQVGVGIIDSIVIIGMLATGNFWIATAATWFILLSLKILHKTEDHSLKKLVNVFGEQSQFVWVHKDGVDIEIPFEDLQVNDVITVNTGETVLADGIIQEGVVSIDQHILTGESQPAEKGVGDSVFASTVVLSGRMRVIVERAGSESLAAQIGDILNNTADFRTLVQTRGQEIADKAALPTLVLGAVTWPLLGIQSAVAALQSAFGYNMRLISPISVLNFLRTMSEHGILIKDGRSLESLSQVDTIVFDKTGTLTVEEPHVSAIYTCHGLTKNELLTYAYAAEYRQTHPIAKAILKEAQKRNLLLHEIEYAKYNTGYGIKVTLSNNVIRVGSARFMAMCGIEIPTEITVLQEESHERGHSLVYVAINNDLGGAIELQPTIRPEAKHIVQHLQNLNMSIYIISGDREEPTRRLAQSLDIDHYFAEILPENKADIVEELQKEGKFVCFVGDGINDSIALKKANISISLRGASTVATDTAQIVLMNGRLNQLEHLFDIAMDFEQNMKTNIMTTIVPGVICVGGVFFLNFGIMSATALYCLGLLTGITNAMLPALKYEKNRSSSM